MGVVAATLNDQAGSGLTVRLAENPEEVQAAQRLRYRVFYEQMGATPSPAMAALGLDFDEYDEVCHHLLAIDTALGDGAAGVVGTYRLQRSDQPGFRRFYTSTEFDIGDIVEHGGRILELGRSCVDERYRGKSIMQLLWQGVARYVFSHGIDLMFGCASLPGNDPEQVAPALSYLHHRHLAPAELRPRALDNGLRIEMDMLPIAKALTEGARPTLPPLVKGYLRLGGFVGDGAVIDRQFNTIDICMIVKTDEVADRYVRHYGRTAQSRH